VSLGADSNHPCVVIGLVDDADVVEVCRSPCFQPGVFAFGVGRKEVVIFVVDFELSDLMEDLIATQVTEYLEGFDGGFALS